MARSSQTTWPDWTGEYQDWLREQAAIYGFDGCTRVTELRHTACLEHDFHYRFARTRYNDPITRRQADDLFASRLPWYLRYRWIGCRLFGGGIWEKHRNVEKVREVVAESPDGSNG